MRLVTSLLLLSLPACASTPPVSAHAHRPSEVAEAAALPAGYESGEALHASCSRVSLATSERQTSLDNVDCSFERLTRILKARAGEQSSRLIVGKRCRARDGGRALQCSASAAYPGKSVALASRDAAADVGPAPSAAQVLDLDEPRPQDGAQISVGFVPDEQAPQAALSPRSYDGVAETHLPSVGRRALGEVSAACAGCETPALHHALRVAAGRLGAGELSDVRCFEDAAGTVCVGSALVPWSS